jgi:hypothetical protein
MGSKQMNTAERQAAALALRIHDIFTERICRHR